MLTFFVLLGLPIFVGIVLGANQTRAGAQLPWLFSILYWVALSVSTWLLMAGGTWLAGSLLRPWAPPFWLAWVLGGIAGSLVARPVIYQFAEVFKQWMDGGQLRAMPPLEFSTQFAVYYMTNWSVILLMWMAAQGLYQYLKPWADRWPEVEQAYSASNSPETRPETSNELPSDATKFPPSKEIKYYGFLERLPLFIGRDVIALNSEDHYLRVFTLTGDALVLVTISEAIRTLESLGFSGLQVHRSWWISLDAVKQTEARDRKTYAVLNTGLEVPISQTYRALFDKEVTMRRD